MGHPKCFGLSNLHKYFSESVVFINHHQSYPIETFAFQHIMSVMEVGRRVIG
jgi:hypothetical protein